MFHFNSIKVRLELCRTTSKLRDILTFQFHKGAIRTGWPPSIKLVFTWFQFHKGAIRTLDTILHSRAELHFNSIKVRLELKNAMASHLQVQFQFHKGAIRTTIHFYLLKSIRNFNSIKVRLEQISQSEFNTNFSFQFHKGAIRT